VTPRPVSGPDRAAPGASRFTWFDWAESKIGKIKVTTGDGGEPSSMSRFEHIQRCLLFDEALAKKDERPTLVFFHWPHEDAKAGKATERLCEKVLNDEAVARWGLLFRCVQIDMSQSDSTLLKSLEAGEQPSFAVMDDSATIVTRIAAPTSSGKMAQALEAAIAKVPAAARRLAADLAAQDAALAEGKAALKADRPKEALAAYDRVRMSTVRVGPQFDRAVQWGHEVEQRLAHAK